MAFLTTCVHLQVGNGERGTGNGERGTGNGERGTGNGERGTGNGERGTGNGERGTGNGEPGTGVWERVYSGNPYKNSKWRTKSRKRVWKLILSTRSAWTIGLGFIEWFYMILTWALAMGSVSLGCDWCSVNSSLNVTQDSKGPPTIVLPT